MAKTVEIADAELPKCYVCELIEGKKVNAEFLAYIGVQVGSQEWQEWRLVCQKHRRSYLAYRLMQVPEKELEGRHDPRSRRSLMFDSQYPTKITDAKGYVCERKPKKWKLEPKIKPLVAALNQLGFIRTISSCEGHFAFRYLDPEDYAGNPDPRRANVIFLVKEGYADSDVDALASFLLPKTTPYWTEAVVELLKHYVSMPACPERIRAHYELRITPFEQLAHEASLREKTDSGISRCVCLVRQYREEA